MKQLKDMQGICKYCVGDCLRLEDESFDGVYRCKDFEKKEKKENVKRNDN